MKQFVWGSVESILKVFSESEARSNIDRPAPASTGIITSSEGVAVSTYLTLLHRLQTLVFFVY